MSQLVSVIMPVYNGERFVAEAIDSVLNQTYSYWELIVVDDGSTDATPEILSALTDPRIKVIRQENGGEAAARNTGLEVATGEILTFLDADDLYFTSALNYFVTYLNAHQDIGVVYSDGVLITSDKQYLMYLSELRAVDYEGFVLDPLTISNFVTAPDSVAVRRNIVEKHMIRFDTSLKYGVDWDFWTQLARHVRFGYIPKPTCMYRVHGANMTSAVTMRKRKHDLLAGRLKVMRTDWFSGLTANTRRAFFYNLLIGLLDEQSDQQWAITLEPAFQALPSEIQANLLRLIATTYLRQLKNIEFATQCLQRSLALSPKDRKASLLLWLAERQPSWATTVLAAWHSVRNCQARLRAIGRRRPRPVPAMLLPTSD